MEYQNPKIKKSKNPLPIKTKVSAGLLIALGGLIMLFLFISYAGAEELEGLIAAYMFIILLPFTYVFIITGVLLLIKNKGCRIVSIVLISILLILSLMFFIFLKNPFLLVTLSLILILVLADTKNFSKAIQ